MEEFDCPLKLGTLQLPNHVLVCPIAGYTDVAFRSILREFTDSLLYAEMISVVGLTRQSEGTLRRAMVMDSHHPVGIQLFGGEADLFYQAGKFVESAGFDLVDINLGCPKIPGEQLGGSKLMKYPQMIKKMIRNLRKAVQIPVTIKMRAGFDESNINCAEIARIAEGEGADGITIHGRTCVQKFRGVSHWEWIRKVVEAVSIPVIANGDIDSPEKAKKILAYTGAKGVMIGRAGLGRPWLIQNISLHLQNKPTLPPISTEEIRVLLLRHLEMTKEHLGEVYLHQNMRKIVSAYFKEVPGIRKIRHQIHNMDSYQKIRQLILDFVPFG